VNERKSITCNDNVSNEYVSVLLPLQLQFQFDFPAHCPSASCYAELGFIPKEIGYF
jgi:hypothetical protein